MFFKAIEDEGGDPENIQLQLSAETPTRKGGKAKGNLAFFYKSQVAPGVVSRPWHPLSEESVYLVSGCWLLPSDIHKEGAAPNTSLRLFWSLADSLTSLLAYVSGALPVNSQ